MTELDTSFTQDRPNLRLEDLPVIAPDEQAIRKNHIIGFDRRDIRSRPFNLLRTTFSRKLKEGGYSMVGVTSATPAAGKTFLSVNLAASLSRVADRPVFLVDLDLWRGSVAESIGYEPEYGIESYLSGEVSDLHSIGRRIEDTNLAVFPARKTADQTAELLAGDHFASMIDAFRAASGSPFVLFDLPPVFANDDAMISLERLDGYVLVVDAGNTTRRQVQDVLNMLQPTECIGSILNRYHGGAGDSYGYGYKYSYGYRTSE